MNKKLKPSVVPLVSIGIPTCNRADLIEQTLQSAIRQDYPNLEIIISDNASTDQTEEICSRLQKEYNNIIYIKHPSNMGATDNFNFVLKQAKGQYFMWLGDDDWIDENYISECTSILEVEASVAIVAGIPKYYYGDTYLYTGFVMNLENNSNTRRVRDYFASVQHNGIFYGVMRTQVIQKKELKNLMGGDLLTIASMVFTGKARTLESCNLHRRRGGSSSDGKSLAKSMALPWLDQYFPRISLAHNVLQHIVHDASFASLSFWQRYKLGLKCIFLAFYRKIQTILFKQKFAERAGIPNR
ncbi:glycosyltransferase family 2 protein [Candidatus Venteria ishoeyi]|uniref:glycosyltransferase family 2 protein n=1 Tax=Candidatus Venteria ishoeyi TaxID=1899563 RepID=UPI0025A6152D|nr:glycosyltransferase family 2 protein [Candidatus Venteria ishoeyi]MDM8546571.1 glycosyltransferase family 2 protein [Candidatus Venteria ishoeyi]